MDDKVYRQSLERAGLGASSSCPLVSEGADFSFPGAGTRPSRPEYQRLTAHLAVLSECFGAKLSRSAFRQAALLCEAVEWIDAVLDPLADSRRRAEFSAEVIAAVEGASVASAALDPLREVASRCRDRAAFVRVCEQLLRNAEEMRTAAKPEHFIDHAVEEGRLLVEALLLSVDEALPPPLINFLVAVAGPANLWDKVLDARSDYRAGQIAWKPDLGALSKLTRALAWQTLALAPRSLLRPRLVGWGIGALWAHWQDSKL